MDQKHKFCTTLFLFVLFGILLYIYKRYFTFHERFSECDRTSLSYEKGGRCIGSEYRLTKEFCCSNYGQREGHVWKGDNKLLIDSQLVTKNRIKKKLKELKKEKNIVESEDE